MIKLPESIAVLLALLGFSATPIVSAQQCQPLQLNPDRFATELRHDSGLLWRISKQGLNDSYLFGTIHVSDPAITDLPAAVSEALSASSHFVMEAKLDAAAMLGFAQKMFYQDGRGLEDLLGKMLYAKAEELLAIYGIPPLAVQSLKPWAAFLTLSMPPGAGLPLDLVLKAKAEELGMTVAGLEAVEEQLSVFQSLDEPTQVKLLVETLCHYAALQQDVAQMKEEYLQRDLAGLFSYHNRYKQSGSDAHQQLTQRLLWDRNRLMAKRMQPILEKGDAFVAIGAMHLPGKRGVLTLLENSGYQLEPIY